MATELQTEAIETTVISADSTPLRAQRVGSGSPLVLVHGGNGDVDTFALIVGALAERHTVWRYSRRGRGGSGDGPEYCMDREIDDLLAVVDAAGGDAHVLGHSGGAGLSLLAAEQMTDLRTLMLYEPVLSLERFDAALIDAVEAAIDADDVDRALELFFPVAGVVEEEVRLARSVEMVWERMRDGARLLPREMRAAVTEGAARMASFTAPDVPTLYLYGEANDAPLFPTLDEVAAILPNAELRGLPGQRHLAFAFDPATFARAVLEFTTAHD